MLFQQGKNKPAGAVQAIGFIRCVLVDGIDWEYAQQQGRCPILFNICSTMVGDAVQWIAGVAIIRFGYCFHRVNAAGVSFLFSFGIYGFASVLETTLSFQQINWNSEYESATPHNDIK
jgi:hypothetical protein